MVGRRLACRDAAGSRARHSTREIVTQPARSSLNPRARHSGRRARGLSDVLGGHPTISRTAAPDAAAPRVRLLVWRQLPRGPRRRDVYFALENDGWTTLVQRNASGPTAFKRSEQIGGVTTCETPSHHAGRPAGAERRRGRPNRSRRRPAAPDTRPADPVAPNSPQRTRRRLERAVTAAPAPRRPRRPLASHPGDALGRPRNNPPDEEDPSEQTVTTTFTLHVFKTTPNNLPGRSARRQPYRPIPASDPTMPRIARPRPHGFPVYRDNS